MAPSNGDAVNAVSEGVD